MCCVRFSTSGRKPNYGKVGDRFLNALDARAMVLHPDEVVSAWRREVHVTGTSIEAAPPAV